jgi:hypothetical protein
MIRNIHPLYLLGLLIMLLITLIWQNARMQDEIAYTQHERAQAREMAQGIVALKKVMKAPNTRALDNFLQGSLFAGSELTHRIKAGRYIISAKRMGAPQVQAFLNRVLNMSVKIVQLKIERQGEKHASVYMEIDL